jgi:IS30 family transposase
LKKKKYSYQDIGDSLDRSAYAVWYEYTKNKVNRKYDPEKADHKAYVRRKYSKFQGKKIVNNQKLRDFVEKMLYDDQSPANISGRIKKHEKHLPFVSKDSIYRYIKSVYGRRIEYHRSKRKSRHRCKRRKMSEKLKDRKFIDERPKIVGKRARIGDAEADFIVSGKSGKGVILNVSDRKSRAPFLEQILNPTINNVSLAFLRIKKRFPELKTITTDNDLLLRNHKELEKILRVKIYFCHAYSSWEKGTVENINGYIRRDIPKGSNISRYSKRFIHSIEEKLQRKIMGCLNYLTPIEVIARSRKRKKRQSAKKSLRVDHTN